MMLKNDREIESYVRWVFVNPGLPWPGVVILHHEFRLRRDLKVTIALPADVNRIEVERLVMMIKSLPFAQGNTRIVIGRPVKDVPAV